MTTSIAVSPDELWEATVYGPILNFAMCEGYRYVWAAPVEEGKEDEYMLCSWPIQALALAKSTHTSYVRHEEGAGSDILGKDPNPPAIVGLELTREGDWQIVNSLVNLGGICRENDDIRYVTDFMDTRIVAKLRKEDRLEESDA